MEVIVNFATGKHKSAIAVIERKNRFEDNTILCYSCWQSEGQICKFYFKQNCSILANGEE